MFYSPYTPTSENLYRAPQANSYFRVFHVIPNAPSVDIYMNGTLLAQNISYRQLTPYFNVPAGNYNITIYPSGQRLNPIIGSNVIISDNSVLNLALTGFPPSVFLYPIPEPAASQNFGASCIRFIHLSPKTAAVDVLLQDGRRIFEGIGYKDITDYACIPAGIYSFQLSTTGSSNILLTTPAVLLQPNTYYTIYGVAQSGWDAPIEALIIPEPRQ